MHGLDHSIRFCRIVSIDLGKFNSVACVYERDTHAHRFVSVQTLPKSIHDLLTEHQTPDPADTLVVMETCDVSGWVYDIATALGMKVAIANPSHEAWRWAKVKRKTDKDDALKLAKLTLLGQLPTVHMPSPEQRQRRRLVHYRRVLVERRTAIRNQVRSIYAQQGLSLPPRGKAWTKAGIKQMSEDVRPIESCAIDDLWRGRVCAELALHESLSKQIDQIDARLDALGAEDARCRLLQGIPGVGPRLAETVVAHLDDPHRFKTAGQVASYAGLVPKQMESGTVKRSGRITRRGPTLLRSMLVEVAWMVYMRNAWARDYVNRISKGIPGRKKIAIVALARKLLVILWAMLRDESEWRDPDRLREEGEDKRCAFAGGGVSPPEDTGTGNVALSSVAVAPA